MRRHRDLLRSRIDHHRATLGRDRTAAGPPRRDSRPSGRRRSTTSCLMRVAVHDHVGVVARQQLGRRRAADLVAVAHVDAHAADRRSRSTSVSRGSPGGSVLPYTARTGAISCELVEDLVAADVAGVQDQLDARERGVHVRPHQAVRVRDQADDVRARRRSFALASLRPTAPTSVCGTPRWSSTRATTKSTRSSIDRRPVIEARAPPASRPRRRASRAACSRGGSR